jgi:hypothetical protein
MQQRQYVAVTEVTKPYVVYDDGEHLILAYVGPVQ